MSYNPYSAAFQALTNKEARRFYADTALEHSFLTLAVASITAQRTYESGQAFRQFYDSHLVPFTLLAIATVVEFFATPEVEVPQLALAGFTPIALLPESKSESRVLVTPFVSENRTLITPAPVVDDAQDLIDKLKDLTTTPPRPAAIGRAVPEPYHEYSYQDLKRLCKVRGISAKGGREALVSRLCNSDLFPEPTPNWKLAPRTAPKTILGFSID